MFNIIDGKRCCVTGTQNAALFARGHVTMCRLSLLVDPPSSAAGRTLTLVAKSVQNLANLVEFGAKVQITWTVHVVDIPFVMCC